MTDLLVPLGMLMGLALVVGALWWLATRVRRRGAGHLMGPFEELWHPEAHRTGIEMHEQAERRAPAPSPDEV